MKIALFADIHGKFLLPFKMVDLYQKQTGETVDLILQCGDMGAFPDIKTLDKATLRHANRDRDELGFYDNFMKIDPEIESFLEKLDLNMICVRGNHEDHDFLDALENENPDETIFSIDAYKRVRVCKSGRIQRFELNDEVLKFIGIGRIGDRKGRTHGEFIQDYERDEIRKLFKSGELFDLLITHDCAGASQRGFGMTEIRETLDKVAFYYHFYGHTGEPFSLKTDDNGITQSVKIKELEFDDDGMLSEGCMIVLSKDGDGEAEFKIVDRSFTDQVTKFNWKYL